MKQRLLSLLAVAVILSLAAVLLVNRGLNHDRETPAVGGTAETKPSVSDKAAVIKTEAAVDEDTLIREPASAPERENSLESAAADEAAPAAAGSSAIENPSYPSTDSPVPGVPGEPLFVINNSLIPYGHDDFRAVPRRSPAEAAACRPADSLSEPEPDTVPVEIPNRFALIPDDWRSLFPLFGGEISPSGPDESDDAVVVADLPEPAESPVIAAVPEDDPEPEEAPVVAAVIPEAPPEPAISVPDDPPGDLEVETAPAEPVRPEEEVVPEKVQSLPAEGPQIIVTNPPSGGYYQSSLLLEGQCLPLEGSGEEGRIRSLSWKIPGMGDYSNTVFMDEENRFQMDLMTAGLTGPQELILESEDFGGRKRQIVLTLKDGSRPPEILPDRDEDRQSYGALFSLKGRLEDSYRGIPELEGIESLSYRLVPQDRSLEEELLNGDVEFTPDGEFQLVLDMRDRKGPQVLQLTVRGRNGSASDLGIALVPGSGDIPSFTMVPQDGRLVFDWDEVPGALEQNLYLSDRASEDPGSSPSSSFQDVKPPLFIDKTVNGRRYSAMLEILTEEGRFWSEVSYAVPLAPGTLSLRAEGGFEQIRLSWAAIPGAERFRIWRRTESEEDFSLIADNSPGSEYIDATATYGTGYFYRIEPADVPGPRSYEVPASSVESPSEKITLASHYRQIVPEKIRVQGGYAYVAAGDGGFHIMDISTPQKPESIGFLDQKGVVDVYQGEEYLYLASGASGFQIVNIEEPTRPFVVLSRVTPDAASIAGRDNLVYLADGLQGLQIFDVSDRQNPQRLSSIRELKISQLELEGNYLYGAGGDSGLVLLDVSNPYSPQTVQVWDDTPVYDVLIRDGYAYLACGNEGMAVYEILGPGNWRRLSRFESVDARMIQLWDSFAMIADGRGGLRVVDVSRPENPQNYGIFGGTDIRALAMTDDYALLADVSGMKVVRTYLFGQSFVQQRWETPGRAYSVTVDGSRLWVADRQGGVSLYEAASPDRMGAGALVRRFETEFAEDLLVRDGRLYVADGPGGVKVFDLDGDSPVDSYSVNGRARRIFPFGSRLGVVTSEEGLLILNSREGDTLSYDSRFYSSDLRDAVFSGSTLFLGDNKDGLIVAEDIGGQFKELNRFTEYSGIRQLLLQGDELFILHRDGVSLLNVNNPEHPVLLAEVSVRNAESMRIKEGLLYLSEGIGGLSVYKAGSDNQLMKVSVCQDIFAVDAAPSGSWVYAADMDGISVIRLIIPDWK